MNNERYKIEVYHKRDKSDLILVIEEKTKQLIIQLIHPFGMHLTSDELGDSLYRFFNDEPVKDIAKRVRHYIFRLPEKYISVGVCGRLLAIKIRGSDEEEAYIDYDEDKEDPKRYAPAIDSEKKLEPYTIARLCDIDVKTCKRMLKNFDTYLSYLGIYLVHKEEFDDVIKKALAPRGKDTKELILFKELLLNPFQTSENVAKKYGIAGESVRQYVMRFSIRIIKKAREDQLLGPDLLRVKHNLLKQFRSIFSAKRKKKIYVKSPRIKRNGKIFSEDNLYKL